METMPIGPPAPQGDALVFAKRDSTGNSANWILVGGIGAILFAVLGFVTGQAIRADQLTMQLMTTLPMVLGIAAIAKSQAMTRTPTRVMVSRQGLAIESNRGIQSFPWDTIGWSIVTTAGTSRLRQLVVYDLQGKVLTKLGEGLENFDPLIDLIRSIIDQKEDDTAETIRQRKGRRSSLFIGAVALLMAGLAVFVFRTALEDRRAERLINEASVQGEAEIVRRFVAPNGVTHRLEYRVHDENGQSAERNAEVTTSYWDSLEGKTTVPVDHVPGEPKISRLLEGEVESKGLSDSPGVMIGLSCALLVMCVVFLAAAVMQWFGWDIDMDSKTGKISIMRYGAGQ